MSIEDDIDNEEITSSTIMQSQLRAAKKAAVLNDEIAQFIEHQDRRIKMLERLRDGDQSQVDIVGEKLTHMTRRFEYQRQDNGRVEAELVMVKQALSRLEEQTCSMYETKDKLGNIIRLYQELQKKHEKSKKVIKTLRAKAKKK